MITPKEYKVFIEPLFNQITDKCPHCAGKCQLNLENNYYHVLSEGEEYLHAVEYLYGLEYEYYLIFRCISCKKLSVKVISITRDVDDYRKLIIKNDWEESFPMILEDTLPKNDLDIIPEEIRLDYIEALKCKTIGASRASCTMFRRALQGALQNLDSKGNSLEEQINSLEYIPSSIKDWAHQIRILGNWGAHPDKDGLRDINSQDVEDAMEFCTNFFKFIFILDQRVKEAKERSKRKGKKKYQNNFLHFMAVIYDSIQSIR